ncbi:ABC transporter substrate-binding protein [Cupriavidus sp. amp6]|uniref:ABC transporter substrate-binding protein n=1 Tax=Cupriavidus sp. amp6 TaxID=388051 RepID=UPI0003F90D39|nr:ABC transporter substrate-binding protein [Cupriavidus sp. amp6]
MKNALIHAVFCGLIFVAGGVDAAEARVAMTAIVDHPALDAARKGVSDELSESGYVLGKNLQLEYQSAQGNNGIAAQIARKFVGDRPNVIVAIATPSAQAVVAATRDIPVVFSAVTDPVAAKLVKSWQATGGNVTGVSDMSPLDQHVKLVKQLVPGAKRIGVVYSPGEANSVVLVEGLKRAATAAGLTVVESAAPRTVDVASAAQSLVGKIDVFYAPTDNNVTSAFESLAKVANQSHIPVVAADTDMVRRGATAALSLNYYDLGRQTGKQVVRILRGEAPGKMPTELSKTLELEVNQTAARKQGVVIPGDLLSVAKKVFE